MLDNLIKPGQRVDMKAVRRVKVDDEERKDKVYTTKIYDLVNDDTLELIMPMEQTKLILLPVDGEYEVFFYTDNGLYECTVRITDRYKSNNVYILLVELQTNLRKYQRRDFYRYSCALDMDTRALTQDEVIAFRKGENYQAPPGLTTTKGVIVDISGGGLRFTARAQYEVDSLIYSRYELFIHGGTKEYQLICKVLDARSIPNRNGEFEYRVQFVNLDNYEREEIIQYIFEEERKNRRKERGFR
ncbi:MAG: flagellar brake protein [Lachnospiraceae bacterium]|nr:flagellar brake protein [Lachnospiraceae bacterium]